MSLRFEMITRKTFLTQIDQSLEEQQLVCSLSIIQFFQGADLRISLQHQSRVFDDPT